MKKKYTFKNIFVLVLITFLSINLQAQTELVFEDFEDNTLTFTSSDGLFHDGGGDYFTIIPLNGAGNAGTISNIQGSNFFGANDIDDGGASPIDQTITWTGLNLTGSTQFTMSAFFAEGDDGGSTPADWDANDSFFVQYRVDGGAWTTFFALETIEPGGDTTNTPLHVDTDFDGTGDGAEITPTLTQYTAMVPVSGSTLDVRLNFDYGAASGDEDLAIDNFKITVDATLGVNDLESADAIKLYPNPATNEFTVSSSNTIEKIELYNVLGSLVLTTKNTTVDISSLNTGAYFARITSDKGITTKRLIKN